MASSRIRVVARILAQPDKVLELKAALLGLINPSRAERGCLSYELYQSETDPSDFVFLEEWEDGSAILAHMQSAHVQSVFAQTASLITTPPDIRRYHLVA